MDDNQLPFRYKGLIETCLIRTLFVFQYLPLTLLKVFNNQRKKVKLYKEPRRQQRNNIYSCERNIWRYFLDKIEHFFKKNIFQPYCVASHLPEHYKQITILSLLFCAGCETKRCMCVCVCNDI